MKRALGTGFIWPDQVDTDTVDDDQIIKKLSEPSLGRRDVLSFERSEIQQYFPQLVPSILLFTAQVTQFMLHLMFTSTYFG